MKLIDKILGEDPWKIENYFYVNYMGKDPKTARYDTIMHWADWGELGPLRVGIDSARPIDDKTVALDEVTFLCLRELIKQNRLVIKPLRRSKGKSSGKRKSPDKFVRDLVGSLRYKQRYNERMKAKRIDKKDKRIEKGISNATFEEVAREIGMTAGALREAHGWWAGTW
jgi:hypothetical protein